MSSAARPEKVQPDRQVVCLAGDGGFSIAARRAPLTVVQEDWRSNIVVYDNGKLGFVDIEQKQPGLVPGLHRPEEPPFREVARTRTLGRFVSKAGDVEEAVQTWLGNPVRRCSRKVNPMETGDAAFAGSFA